MSELTCPAREDGGFQCERLDPHGEDGHWMSAESIRARLQGEGRDFRTQGDPRSKR